MLTPPSRGTPSDDNTPAPRDCGVRGATGWSHPAQVAGWEPLLDEFAAAREAVAAAWAEVFGEQLETSE